MENEAKKSKSHLNVGVKEDEFLYRDNEMARPTIYGEVITNNTKTKAKK